ncbi:NADH:ubiquinone oxidoreductase [Boothiomyces sp. JEL0866]|nr:NADH:ubiquinone oxidoreductase [Boothiomyces sp. JEL0866]
MFRKAISQFAHIKFRSASTQTIQKKSLAGRLLRWTIYLGAGGALGIGLYEIYSARHPPEQFSFDPSKKTLAILGSGWAATSFLKDLDTENFNVIMVSPRNYFLFTPLLPSCTVGTIELRSIMQPLRYITRFKNREVMFVEADCTNIDSNAKTITIKDNSEVTGLVSERTLPYDYLVVATGSENATFGIPGVKEHGCFLKEAWDARKIRTKLMDCIESAAFPGQPDEEVKRLLHMVVVGGGPTGVEYAAELHDFLIEDLLEWYPHLAEKIKITLVEALPNVLPMFSKSLIEYTEKHLARSDITLMKNTAVKAVEKDHIVVSNSKKELETIPYGLLVWATGNTPRPVVSNFIKSLPPTEQNQRRGIVVDEFFKVKGCSWVYSLGDASATKYAPTAQVASGEGRYLAKLFNALGQDPKQDFERAKEVVGPFNYEHMGSLAYIGSDRAIADLPFGIKSTGLLTHFFWRSAYLSNLFAFRNRCLVAFDWSKKNLFGRDISRE